ncbi:SHV-163 [Klebsiella oxytoca]|nr:SHV-163 [Klebsiella oxytoca]CAH5006363.1 SHV-163 [Klebsiella oxytoca]
MAVNQSANSGYSLGLSAAAGLLVGLSLIYFWPELASWWPADLPVYIRLCII